jgi:sugar phosphate isomerase/epimerase
MFRIGCCGEIDADGALQAAGFDFCEVNVQTCLVPLAAEAAFVPRLEAMLASKLPCEAANCFLPGHLKATGPEVDLGRLLAYAGTACERARRAGIGLIVFGSGGARQVPTGFPMVRALEQLAEFARRLGPLAAASGVTVVMEHLAAGECNILNTVPECARIVAAANHPNVRLLADSYHWLMEHETPATLIPLVPQIAHVHLATAPARVEPGAEPCDFMPFLRALRRGGYGGAWSIECLWRHPGNKAAAVTALRDLLAAAG